VRKAQKYTGDATSFFSIDQNPCEYSSSFQISVFETKRSFEFKRVNFQYKMEYLESGSAGEPG